MGDTLDAGRRRLAGLRRSDTVTASVDAVECEKSEISEESPPTEGVISHISLISQSVPVCAEDDDPFLRARRRLRELQHARSSIALPCEKSEMSEMSSDAPPVVPSPPTPALLADPLRAWRLRNAERLTDDDRRLGHDPGGFCVEHNRWLTWPEQRRGACSWCVPVDPDREPEYWASHWRRFAAR
jgi:hypothetical protein